MALAVELEHGPPMDLFLAQEPLVKEIPAEHLPPTAALVAEAVAQAVPAAQRAEQPVVPQETVSPAASQVQQPSMPPVVLAMEPVLEVQPVQQVASLR